MTLTCAAPTEVPTQWLRGRARYGVWVLDADTGPLREQLAAARAHLGDWLWPTARQPHVTVWVGGFLCETPVHDDDLPPAVLADQQAALRVAAPPPFDLHIGGLDTFDAAAYLRVEDRSGALQRLRHRLQDGRGEFRATPYVPHVTAGLYRQAVPRHEVMRRMAAWQAKTVVLPVGAVRFVSYDAARLDGPLRDEWVWPL